MSPTSLSSDADRFCQRPLVRRAYCGLVVGLAVFLLTLVVLREPFHGYLAEVRIDGPASAGLDLEAARAWLKAVDSQATVVTLPGGNTRARSEIRITYRTPRPASGPDRLDDLAGRLLYQFIPDQLQAIRHSVMRRTRQAVAAAREQEDAARQRIDLLREAHLADLIESRRSRQAPEDESISGTHEADGQLPQTGLLRQRLAAVRAELENLLASCTAAHPEVIRLKAQVARLEQQLREERTDAGVTVGRSSSSAPPYLTAVATASNGKPLADRRDWTAELEAARRELSDATRLRQSAEHEAADALQELAALPTAADWSAAPAYVVTRIGGTPRTATIALGVLLAAVAGIATFRFAAHSVAPRLETAGDLATALEIPVIGTAASSTSQVQRVLRVGSRVGLRGLIRAAETVLGVAAVACVLAVAVEPALGPQVLADPFGTLSETLGRLG